MGTRMSAHSPLGPSSAERWLNCPGSVLATKDLPDTDSDYALEGTAAHELAELARETDRSPLSFIGTKIHAKRVDGTSKEFVVDQEMADAVAVFVDHVNGLPGLDFNESKVYYREWVENGFGTMDAARGNNGTVYIRDLKYGKGVQVFAEDNEQLMLYALGFFAEYGYLYWVEKFNVGIVQPRLDFIDTWEISLHDLVKWASDVVAPGAKLAMTPGAPFKAGSHCQFCKIRGTCAARAQSVFEEVVDQFDDLDAAVAGASQKKFVAGVLGNEQIAKILPVIPNIKAWCSDIQRYAFAEVRSGRAVGDYKIVEGKLGDRAWVPGAEEKLRIEADKLDPTGINSDEAIASLYEPAKLRGPVAVEKLLGKPRFKPATQTKPAGDLHDLIVRPPGKPTLVSGDDGRPAMVFDAANVFEELEEDFE